MSTATTVQQTEIAPIYTRVSWSSVFAGAVVAMAVYFLLATFGAALGFTLADRVSERSLGISAAIWSIVSVLVSLFIGGFVTAQCAVGQTHTEGVIHGLILWGLFFTALLWLLASGMTLGFQSLLGTANGRDWFAATTERVEPGTAPTPAEQLREKAQAEWNTHRNTVIAAAWWSLLGIFLSMAASIAGAILGAGRTLVLQRSLITNVFRVRTDDARQVPVR
jgi:MFS family permease